MDRSKNDGVVLSTEGLSRRKFIGGVALAGGMVGAGALAGCGSSNAVSYTPVQQRQLVVDAVNNFAATYPTSPVKPGIPGPITPVTTSTIPTVVANMTDLATIYVPVGDPTVPTSLTAVRLGGTPGFTSADAAAYNDYIKSIVTASTSVTYTPYTVGGVNFTAITINDANGVIYDSFLSNLITVTTTSRSKECLRKTYRNGFLRVVGTIVVTSTANCRNGVLVSPLQFTAVATSTFALLFLKVNAKAGQIAGTQCQRVSYSWAYSAPINRIATGDDDFTLSAPFPFGSAGTGNCEECCVTGGGGGG